MVTYAVYTAIFCARNESEKISRLQQINLDSIDNWATKCRIKINPNKSVYVPFMLKRINPPPVYFHSIQIPSSSDVKYLGITLDKRLTWSPHCRDLLT